MDMITAYNDVGSYRGAAAVCGVDHKTVKRAVAGQGRPAGPPAGTITMSWPTLSPNGSAGPRPVSRPNACCQKQEPLVMAALPATSGRLVARPSAPGGLTTTGAQTRGLGAGRGARHRLGRRGRPAHLLCRHGFFPLALRAFCHRRARCYHVEGGVAAPEHGGSPHTHQRRSARPRRSAAARAISATANAGCPPSVGFADIVHPQCSSRRC